MPKKNESMHNLILTGLISLISFYPLYSQKTESKFYTDSIFSNQLGEYRKYNVYLPPGFDSKEKYKIIYATDGDEVNAQIFVKTVLDSLIENQIIKPMVYVGSHSNNKNIAGNSMKTDDGMTINIQYRNFEYVENFDTSGFFNELSDRFKNHMDYFKNELILHIEQELKLSMIPADRIFYGVSNGAGFGANLLNKHPDIIGTYICYSTLGSNVEKNKWNVKISYPDLYLQYGNNEDELFKTEAKNLKEKYRESSSFCELKTFNGGHDYKQWNQEFTKTIVRINPLE